MIVEKVFVREVAPEVGPEDLQLVVMLSGDQFEAVPVHLGQHPRSFAYNLVDLAERLMRRSNKEFKNGKRTK